MSKKLTHEVFYRQDCPDNAACAVVDEQGVAYWCRTADIEPFFGMWSLNARGCKAVKYGEWICEKIGDGYDASDWKNSMILREEKKMEKFKGFMVPAGVDLNDAVRNFHSGYSMWCDSDACGYDSGACEDCLFCCNNGDRAAKISAFVEYVRSKGFKIANRPGDMPSPVPKIEPGMILEFEDGALHFMVTEELGYEIKVEGGKVVLGEEFEPDLWMVQAIYQHSKNRWPCVSDFVDITRGNEAAESILVWKRDVPKYTYAELRDMVGHDFELVEEE